MGLRAADASWMELDEFHRLYPYQLEDELIVQWKGCHVGRQVPAQALEAGAHSERGGATRPHAECDNKPTSSSFGVIR
jgi:hypothetical protein